MFSQTFLLGLFLKCNLAQCSCPVPESYCLNRDPSDSCQVRATDHSNRSMLWSWECGPGTWNIAYHSHSFPGGSCSMEVCYTSQQTPACVSYSTAEGWKSNLPPNCQIPASGWDIRYNGDTFGFRPAPNGQHVFHIYSRNLYYNPWMSGNDGHPGHNGGLKNCRDTENERTKGNGWWLERKSRKQCPVVVNSGDLVSPMEWSWQTAAGRWKVVYTWGKGIKCTVHYNPAGASAVRQMSWVFNNDQLKLDYTAAPNLIYSEPAWKMMVSGGETWGFTSNGDGTWVFPVYSRNVIIKPFEKARGTFNLQYTQMSNQN